MRWDLIDRLERINDTLQIHGPVGASPRAVPRFVPVRLSFVAGLAG
jgi:hypothetical protein